MKGLIFTEFLELVEDKFSPELADEIIVSCDLPNGGTYTSVGAYDHNEIVSLVLALSDRTDIPAKELITTFGQHLVGRFNDMYPDMFKEKDTFSFLDTIHNHVHVEVRKLYPDAELPDLSTRMDGDDMIMDYDSSRPFSDLAFGLIQGAVEYFKDDIDVVRETRDDKLHTQERFRLIRR